MSRQVERRWELTGDLIAESPVHVGGLGNGPPDLLQARDGRGRPVLPGASLAGVLQAALPPDAAHQWLWQPESPPPSGQGRPVSEASWVRLDDAPATQAIVEAREHVSIDRVHGAAARGHLFTREVLAAGTRFAFRLVVDDPGDRAASELVQRIAALLRGPGVTVGAARTRGLGRVRLHEAQLHRYDLRTRAGMLDTLRGRGLEESLPPVAPGGLAGGLLRVTIPWRQRGPLLVQVAAEGDAADAFPLATTCGDQVRLELPGSTIKGVLRSHAERIVRTVAGEEAPEAFLDQLRADELGPVADLFGAAADHRVGAGEQNRRGALAVNTCVSDAALPDEKWGAVRLRGRAAASDGSHATVQNDAADEDERAELAYLQRAVDDLNRAIEGIRFVVGPHVAVDRWTGGAADGRLFTNLEAHPAGNGGWRPIVLDLEIDRLADSRWQALALLVLVLRDLCDGWIGFGHGTTRGMGAVMVDPEEVRFHVGATASGDEMIERFDGKSLAEVLADRDLSTPLSEAWDRVVRHPETTGLEDAA